MMLSNIDPRKDMVSRPVEHRPAMFITAEGIEGCGKSTLLAGLAHRLRAAGKEIVLTREPGGTQTGDAIRKIFLEPGLELAPLTEALLVNAARVQHVLDAVEPALRAGAVVLCDRFTDSTLAYQGYGRGIDLSFLRRLCDAATGGLVPDITFVIDVPVAISRERIAGRREQIDRVEAEDDAFHERVRGGYLNLAREASRYRVLDGTKPSVELLEEALSIVTERVA